MNKHTSNSCYFDPIIKKVSTFKKENLRRDEKIVVIDEKTGEVVTNSWFQRNIPGRNRQTYLISTYERVNCSDIPFEIRDSQKNKEIVVLVSYEVKIKDHESNYNKAVQLFSREVDPIVSLHKFIERQLRLSFDAKRNSRLNDFIDGFYNLKEDLCEQLKHIADKEGLQLSITMRLENDERLRTIELQTDNYFEVNLGNELQKIKYKAELGIKEEKRVNAVRKYASNETLRSRYSNIIENKIKKIIRDNDKIQPQTFLGKLNGDIKNILIQELNIELEEEGREINYFQLVDGYQELDLPSFLEFDFDRTYKANDFRPTLTHQLTLEQDPHTSNIYYPQELVSKGLEEWIKDIVYKETHKLLVEQTYLKLAIDFDRVEGRIKNQVAQHARGIGYQLTIFTSKPDIEEVQLHKEGFNLVVGNGGAEFETKKNNVKVKLEVEVDGKIEDLEKVQHMIKPHADPSLRDKLRNSIYQEIKRELHRIEPERFYLEFETTEKAEVLSVSEVLDKAIRKKLEGDFSVVNLDIRIRQLETDLVKRFESLKRKHHSFEFQNFAQEIKYSGKFRVIGMDPNGWQTFKELDYPLDIDGNPTEELKEIQETIEHEMADKLNNFLKLDFLSVKAPEFRQAIEKWFRETEFQVMRSFGLQIQITRSTRQMSETERSILEQRVKESAERQAIHSLDVDSKLSQIASLQSNKKEEMEELTRLKARAIKTGDEEEAERLQRLIDERAKDLHKRNNPSEDLMKLEGGLSDFSGLSLTEEHEPNVDSYIEIGSESSIKDEDNERE